MGYDVSDTKKLELPEYPGADVVVKLAATMEEFSQMGVLAQMGGGGDPKAFDAAIVTFGDQFLESWDITLNGQTAEPNGANFARLPMGLKFAVVTGWMSLMRGPDAPLGQESSNGLDSPDE